MNANAVNVRGGWLAAALLSTLACTAEITGDVAGSSGSSGGSSAGGPGGLGPSAGSPGTAGTGGSGPAQCAATGTHPVNKLLRLSNEEYQNVVSDVIGTPVGKAAFIAWTPVAEVYGFDTMTETRIDARGLGEQLHTSEALAKLALQSPTLSAACPAPIAATAPAAGTSLTWDNCGKPLMQRLGSRAFRRPLRADELSDYQQLFEASQAEASAAALPHPFYEGLTTAVQAALLSPSLMFKPELVPSGLTASERAYGIASKLALFFRSSVADDELWGLAESGKLNDPLVVEQQATRLLEQYQERFMRSFGGQWLDFRDDLPGAEELMVSMKNETRDVFREVLLSGLPPQRLMAPGFTFLDQPLATHYGLPFDAGGPAVQKVTTDARGGLLSQGYFLKRTAMGSEFRRPIHRGLWTMTRLLCRELPRLDAATVEEISASFENIDRTLPLSEQMAIHRSGSQRCLGCHAEIDPIGLALEKYDKQGLWREVDINGHPIVSDLELFGAKVGEPLALASAIEGSDEYPNCVAMKALTYALNRGPLLEERCVAEELAKPRDGVRPSFKAIAVSALLKSITLADFAP